jgi:photosystem II protein
MKLILFNSEYYSWIALQPPVLCLLPCGTPLCPGVRPFQGGASLAAPRLQAPKQHLQVCEAASLQFIKGVNESTVPDVSLRRARTGTSGQAMFTFENPSIFQASSELGDITGEAIAS